MRYPNSYLLSRPIISFEDLRGLRAVGYIRDSTLDQRDGFDPDIQRRNEERFAESYGLILSDRWYTEFVTGRSMQKRVEFLSLLEDARLDEFDVLLVDHTSRFGRNQVECIRYKEQLRDLGKVVIFVSQGIISGSDRDFLSERINETLDEAYSRGLSRYVKAGLAEKAAQGHAIGSAPLGYRNEKSHSGRGAHSVEDPQTMPALLAALGGYASGKHSFRTLAQELNSRGFRTSKGKPFTESSISTILNNRFYIGEVIYHRGRPDEEVIPGAHEVPDEIRQLWSGCQEVRLENSSPGQNNPASRLQRVYPLTGVLKCDDCSEPFHGIGIRYHSGFYLRRSHSWHRCDMRPRSVSAPKVEKEFAEQVLGCINLDEDWRNSVLSAMTKEGPEPDRQSEITQVDAVLANLRKQHLWGVISDKEFKDEHTALERQRRDLEPKPSVQTSPNLDRAAELLKDLPALWEHSGVTPEQRRELAREVFEEVRIRDGQLVAVKPKPQYEPLFAYSIWKENHDIGGERSS